MTDARKEMNEALKGVVVPVLRDLGFKGTFPNFYREAAGHVDLLSFQFRLAGGSFVVELSFADPARENVYIDKDAPANKLRPSQTTKRFRLGAKSQGSDNWYSFEPVGLFKRQPDYMKIATLVADSISKQAVTWWTEQRHVATVQTGPL
ncbi:MAG: DUF4304 domain-containing protein [Telluria sp.]